MRSETLAEAVQELYVRFDPALMIEATKDQSLFITDRNAAMILFKYLPNENNPLLYHFKRKGCIAKRMRQQRRTVQPRVL